MNNKILIRLVVPEVDECYDIFIPINVRVGTVINLINKMLMEFTNGEFEQNNKRQLYNVDNSLAYDINDLIRNTNIKNASNVIFL